jgi:ABC-2 type transport system permease protein
MWGYIFGIFVASSVYGYASLYKTPAQRASLAKTFGANAGASALVGPAHGLATVAGFTAWRSLVVLCVLGAIWGLLASTRLLRGEEDAGRWELLLAGQTTPRLATAQAGTGLATGLFVLWAVTAAITVAVGRFSSVRVSVGAGLFFALALVSGAAMFLAVGVLTSQLAATRRQAAAYAGAVLGVSYGVRMLADSGTGLEWLRWLSPIGWVEELQPLTAPRPLALVPIAASVVLLSVVAMHLAGNRDLGASTIPDGGSGLGHTRLLSGPTGLTLRLFRPTAIGWSVGIAAGSFMIGIVAKSAGSATTGSSFAHVLSRLGSRGSGVKAYVALSFLVLAVLLTLVVAGQVTAARAEESEGRLEHLLVRPVARRTWLAGKLLVTTCVLSLLGIAAGLFVWLGAATQDSDLGLSGALGAGLNIVPPAIALTGIGILTLGLWPRAVSGVTYAVLAWSILIEVVGGIVNANHYLLDTSLFHHMAAAPSVSPDWAGMAVLVAVGLAGASLGEYAFDRRDLAGA